MKYRVLFSKRKTIGLTVKNAELIVRAPIGTDRKIIDDVVFKHQKWVVEKISIQEEKLKNERCFSEDEIEILKNRAKKYFGEKTKQFAEIMGVNYGRITITSAKHRFGSCSSKGNICYSYRLMLYPEEARDYVVVHELSHRIEMNHSQRFYKIIEKYMPDYKERKRLLK